MPNGNESAASVPLQRFVVATAALFTMIQTEPHSSAGRAAPTTTEPLEVNTPDGTKTDLIEKPRFTSHLGVILAVLAGTSFAQPG